MKTIDDLVIYIKEKEEIIGKNAIVKNPVFSMLLSKKAPVIIYRSEERRVGKECRL